MTLRVKRLSASDPLPSPTSQALSIVSAQSSSTESAQIVIPSEMMHDGQIDTAWAMQTLQTAAEEKQSLTREVSESLAALRNLAKNLCKDEWEVAMRHDGGKPEEWGAARLGELIRDAVSRKIESLETASDPQLDQKHIAVTNELARANTRIEMLAQQYSDARKYAARLTQDNEKLQQQLARAKREGGGGRDDSRPPRRNTIQVFDNQASSAPVVAQSSGAVMPQASVSAPAESSLNVSDELVKFLAATGMSRSKEIKEKFARYLEEKFNRRKSPTNVRDDLMKLIKQGLLIQYEIRLERRGQSKGYMYELSPSGVQRAKQLGVRVVESEVKKGKRSHDSLEHFYQILDVSDVLVESGYSVSLYESAVSFQDGTKYLPDIKAIAPDKRTIYVEVERTPTTADELENKYVRAAVLCNGDLFIGVINKSKKRKVGMFALEIKARRGNAIQHLFMLNVGERESATLWQEISQPGDLGVDETEAEDESEDGEN